MPLYEYQCIPTGKRFEAIRKFSDPPLTECPECGGEVKKLLSAPAIQFKGAGWYVNDYGKGGEKPKKDSATSDSGASDSKPAETKAAPSAESKPAAKESSSSSSKP